MKGVTENAKTRNPAHVGEGQGPAYVKNTNRKSGPKRGKREIEKRVLTSKDFTEVLVDFEPVRQHAKRKEEDGEAEQENSHKHARGEPDFTGERRDEVVLWKAKEQVSTSGAESAVGE